MEIFKFFCQKLANVKKLIESPLVVSWANHFHHSESYLKLPCLNKIFNFSEITWLRIRKFVLKYSEMIIFQFLIMIQNFTTPVFSVIYQSVAVESEL